MNMVYLSQFLDNLMRSNINFILQVNWLIFSLSIGAMENSNEGNLGFNGSTSLAKPLSERSLNRPDPSFMRKGADSGVDHGVAETKKLQALNTSLKKDIQKLLEKFAQLKVPNSFANTDSLFDDIRERRNVLRKLGSHEISLVLSLVPSFIEKTREITLQRLNEDTCSFDMAFDALEPLLFGVRDNYELRKAIKNLKAMEYEEAMNDVVFIDDDEEINAKLQIICYSILTAKSMINDDINQLKSWIDVYFDDFGKKEASPNKSLLKFITLQFIDAAGGEKLCINDFFDKARSILIRSTYPVRERQIIDRAEQQKTPMLIPNKPRMLSESEQTALIKKRGLPR